MNKTFELCKKAAATQLIAEAAITKAAEEVNLSRLQRKQAEAMIPDVVEELVKVGLVENTPERCKIAAAALADPANALQRLKKLASMVSVQQRANTAPGDVVPSTKRASATPVNNSFDEANESFVSNL